MHRHHRGRGKILFEVFCALSLAASFAGAWDQTGSSALLASASIVALFAFYWSFGLFARDRLDDAAKPTAAVAQAPAAQVETAAQVQVFACEPEVPAEPEPVAPAPKKRRARKAKAEAVVTPAVEPPQPVVHESVSDRLPLEQLFDPQPYIRQQRNAFGRKSRGPSPLNAA